MADSREIALSELIGALSRALDVAEGEPPGHAVRTCLIGMRIAEAIALDARRPFGPVLCAAAQGRRLLGKRGSHGRAVRGRRSGGQANLKLVNWARPLDALVWSLRTVAPEGSLAERTGRLRAIRNEGQVTRSLMRARCHRGAEIALKLGFSEATAEAIRALDEHWDGHGQPHGLRGSRHPPRGAGSSAWRRRWRCSTPPEARAPPTGSRASAAASGSIPALVDALGSFRFDTRFWASLKDPDVSAVSRPTDVLTADEARLDQIAEGFAAVIDAKSPWTHEHCDRGLRDRHRDGPADGLRRAGAAPASPRRAAARPRQAVDLQPDPGQAGAADREERARFQRAPAAGRADPRASRELRRAGRGGQRPPRASRRQRIPPRAGRRRPHHADARLGRRRCVRGAHLRPALPGGLPVGQRSI